MTGAGACNEPGPAPHRAGTEWVQAVPSPAGDGIRMTHLDQFGNDDNLRHDEYLENHDQGLSLDLPTLLSRRRLLGLLGVAGVATVAACTTDGAATTDGTNPGAAAASPTLTTGTKIPEETGGPYPGDGSNGVNVLTQS